MAEEIQKEETSTSSASVDYKAELEKAQKDLAGKSKELDQARFTLKKKNIEEKKSKVFESEEEEKDSEPDTQAIIQATVQQELNKTKAEEFLSRNSTNQDEIELARFHLENTIKPSGNPEFDAQAALSIANRGSLIKKNEEMKTAMLNKKQMMSTSGGSSSSQKETTTTDFGKTLTPEQINTLRTVHRMNDKQIEMFIQKRQGEKHTLTP